MALLIVNPKGTSIRVLVDNTEAIYAIKKGFTKTYHLKSLPEQVRKILRFLEQTLDIRYIKGSCKFLSDKLSRNTVITAEGSLPQTAFSKMILRRFPNLEWNLFTASLNNKLPKFASPCPDQGAAAMMLSLQIEIPNRMSPPTPLISRVLEKLASTLP